MKNGKLQCKDVPTLPILRYVAEHGGIGCVWWEGERSVCNAVPPGTPEKLILAKMRNMISKGLVDGCSCGCRGDFEITDKGRARILELEGGVLQDCATMWPEPWTREALEAKREELRRNPHAFASMFIQVPMPDSSQHMVDFLRSGRSFEIDLAASLRRDRLARRTRAMIENITALALSGTDVSGVTFRCESKAQAERVIEELRRRLGQLGIGLPTAETKTP